MENFLFSVPSKVYFGPDEINKIGQIIERTGRRVLIVTEDLIAREVFFQNIVSQLNRQGINPVVFNDIGIKTTADTVETITSFIRTGKIQTLIGMGGNRCLSLAKFSAAMTGYQGRIDSILSTTVKPNNPVYYIEIPTSHRNPVMLSNKCHLIDSRDRSLKVVQLNNFFADSVIIDPNVNSAIPAKLAYATLMDCFMQAIEGYFSQTNTFLSEMIFLKTIGTITTVLKQPRENLSDSQNRLLLCRAGFLCALGLNIGNLGIGSAITASLAAKYFIPKSLIATVMMPHLLTYGLKHCPVKLARIAPILDLNTEDLSLTEIAERVVELVRYMIGMENMPMRLKELGITINHLNETIPLIMGIPYINTLPVPYSRDDLFLLMEQAI